MTHKRKVQDNALKAVLRTPMFKQRVVKARKGKGSYQRNGIQLSDARNQYLAYHEGHTGYARGSYNRKSWLLGVANKVEARSNAYKVQLDSCRKFR